MASPDASVGGPTAKAIC
jgi:hypothetical protein